MNENFKLDLRDHQSCRRFYWMMHVCFTSGYTLPQYCLEKQIKKPLFLAVSADQEDFMLEVHAQFKYAKTNVQPTFSCFNFKIEKPVQYDKVINNAIVYQDFANLNLDNFDQIFVLTSGRFNANSKNLIYLNQLADYFYRQVFCDIPITHFLQNHPTVKMVLVNCPLCKFNKQPSEAEQQLPGFITQLLKPISESKDGKVKTPFDFLGYTNRQVSDLVNIGALKTTIDTAGIPMFKDNDNPLINIHGGRRTTAYQPEHYKNKIYFLGTCPYFGIGAPFDKNIESYLQKMLNDNNLPYRVENYSQFFNGRYQDIFYVLNSINFSDGDIVFFSPQHIEPNNLPFFNLENIFARPHEYGEVFTDKTSHLNERGYKILAEKYFNYLTENDFFKHTDFEYPPPHLYLIVMVYRRRISQARQSFCRTRTWTITKQSCVANDLRLAA